MSIKMLPVAADGFKGHVSPQVVCSELSRNKNSYLVDVRTRPEWVFVGTIDEDVTEKILFIEWQKFPDMAVNPQFVSELEKAIEGRRDAHNAPMFFLCRSGGRSQSAARAATAAGFNNCFNVAGGFEGDKNAAHQRGARNGWKAAGCPWRQL